MVWTETFNLYTRGQIFFLGFSRRRLPVCGERVLYFLGGLSI